MMPPRLLQRVLRATSSRLPSASSLSSSPTRVMSSTPSGAKPPPPPRVPPSSSSNLLSIDDRLKNPSQRGARSVARPGDAATNMFNRMLGQHQRAKLETIQAIRNAKDSNDYLRQMPRRWTAGDVYSPHDLSPVEMQKWRKRSVRKNDVVDALGIRPLDMYKNFSLVQEFTTSSGQIIHSAGTSLRPVNQRKIAKMIRRVQGMGLYPTIHDHPEMIRDSFFPDK